MGPSLSDYYEAKKEKSEDAEQILLHLIKRDPDSPLLNKEMAYLLIEKKEYEESLSFLKKAEQLDPADEKIGLQIGYVLDLLNKKKEALEQFKKMSRSENQEIEIAAKKAVKNLSPSQPETDLKKHKVEPDVFVKSDDLNEFYRLKKSEKKKAEEYLKSLIQKKPHNLIYLKEMGYLLLERNDFNNSLEWFKKAEKEDPNDLLIVLQKGYIYQRLGQKKLALESFEAVLQSNDPHLRSKAEKAISSLEVKDEKAISSLEVKDEPIALIEDSYTTDLNRYYQLKKENSTAAEHLLKTLIVRYPDKTDLYKEMGYNYLNRNLYEDALFYFQKASLLSPNEGRLLLQIGFIFDALKRKDEAIAIFEKAAQFPDNDISEKALVALKNLKGDGKKVVEEEKKSGLDLFYEWKDKDEVYACQILSEYLEENPDDLQANKEMAFLQLKFKHKEWALYYFEKSYQLDPCNQDIVIQITTLLYQLDLNQSATAFITRHICASCSCEERKKYCEVRYNLIKEYARLLPKPFFLELAYNAVYFRRFRNLVNYFYSRLGVTFGPNDSLEAYFKTYITRDTRSQTVGLPQIFSDNVWLNSIGLRIKPFKNFPYVGLYAEGGRAYDLDYLNRNRWRNDFRGGGFFYKGYEPHPLCSPCYLVSLRPFADIYADVSYYSRYQNWIGYGRVRPGFILIEKEEASLRAYGKAFLGLDSKHEYFNNFLELGPGISFHPTDLLNFAIRFEWIKGYYIKVDSPSINPYGNRYYDARIQIDYFVVY